MGLPVTAYTPTYQLAYLEVGQPMRDTRAVTQQIAETLEAALIRGGIAPPGVAELAALVARVVALEPGVWTTLPRATGVNLFAGDWSPPRVRHEGGDVVRIQAALSGPLSAGATIATVPAGFRPTDFQTISANVGATGTWVQVDTNGSLVLGMAVPSGGFVMFNDTYPRT
jgi:hypothetical protein